MNQESSSTSQNRLESLLIHYRNRKKLTDDYGNVIVMFFNENFYDNILPLMSAYKHHKVSRVSEDKRKAIFNNGIISIKETIKLLSENYKLELAKFIAYGQKKGKDWDYLTYSEFKENEHIIPKPKQKFINPRKRKRYVISER